MHLTADPIQPLVQLGGVIIEGWLADLRCGSCGGTGVYYLAHLASFCPTCNVWLEVHCNEPDCEVCRCRPARPLAGGAPA